VIRLVLLLPNANQILIALIMVKNVIYLLVHVKLVYSTPNATSFSNVLLWQELVLTHAELH